MLSSSQLRKKNQASWLVESTLLCSKSSYLIGREHLLCSKSSYLIGREHLLCSKYWKTRRLQFNIKLTHYTFWFINIIYLISDISKLKQRERKSSRQIAKIRQHERLTVYGTGVIWYFEPGVNFHPWYIAPPLFFIENWHPPPPCMVYHLLVLLANYKWCWYIEHDNL